LVSNIYSIHGARSEKQQPAGTSHLKITKTVPLNVVS